MNKKGQLTIFIILGVILIGTILLVILLSNPLLIRGTSTSTAKALADSCFSTSEVCTLHQLGNTAGNLEFTEQLIPLYEMEDNANLYFKKASTYCQDDFKSIVNEKVDSEAPNPEVFFNMKDTTFKTKQKITITSGGKVQKINDFVTQIPVRYESCAKLANNIKEHTITQLDNSYINAVLLEDPSIDANVYEGESNVIVLTDRESRIEDTKYKFSFIK